MVGNGISSISCIRWGEVSDFSWKSQKVWLWFQVVKCIWPQKDGFSNDWMIRISLTWRLIAIMYIYICIYIYTQYIRCMYLCTLAILSQKRSSFDDRLGSHGTIMLRIAAWETRSPATALDSKKYGTAVCLEGSDSDILTPKLLVHEPRKKPGVPCFLL